MNTRSFLISVSFCSIIVLLSVFDSDGSELQSAEQLTKDLIVIETRGITVQPSDDSTQPASFIGGQQQASSTDTSQGRVDMYIQFEYDKSNLTEKSKIQLQELAKAMKDERLLHDSFLIAGHTDAVGTDTYNQILSEKRANAVIEYLISDKHIEKNRLIARGFGEAMLKNETNPQSSENRRVEVVNTRALQ